VSDPGGTLINIPNTTITDLWPSFSPDGQWVAFQRNTGNEKMRIYRIKLDGNNLTALTDGNHLDEMPYYSPDGQHILFKRGGTSSENADICRMNSDGTGLTNLTNRSTIAEDAPIYAWDGKFIAYQGGSGGPTTTKIYTANPSGSGSKTLTNDNLINFNPTFSPLIGSGEGSLLLLLSD
jgi:TolB protein